MNRTDALEILVHEYCHLTQWIDDIPLWKMTETSGPLLDDWLAGKSVRNIKKHIANMRDLELDNERRAVKLIKEWGLSIDIPQYIKKANAYILFYNWLYFTRKWSSPDNTPYTNEHILTFMSDKFNMKYSNLSDKVLQAFMVEQI
jgi:hypothetical protein